MFEPPVWRLRGLLVLTCTTVRFFHGTNDGQKSIGLIMLTIIGLMPATYAWNPDAADQLAHLSEHAGQAIPLIQRHGDDRKDQALRAAAELQQAGPDIVKQAGPPGPDTSAARQTRAQLRGDIYDVLAQMKPVGKVMAASAEDKQAVGTLRREMGLPVRYASVWVRVLSALCLGIGTIVGSALMGTASFAGLPVSTTQSSRPASLAPSSSAARACSAAWSCASCWLGCSACRRRS